MLPNFSVKPFSLDVALPVQLFFVRIDGDALFVTNGSGFDGHSGGAFFNSNGATAMYVNAPLC